jgi:hypothetical protein
MACGEEKVGELLRVIQEAIARWEVMVMADFPSWCLFLSDEPYFDLELPNYCYFCTLCGI